jgi:hypothetical protein
MYPLRASPTVAGLPITSLFKGTPESALISKREVLKKPCAMDLVRREGQFE